MKTSDQVVLEEEHIEKDMNNNQQESLLQWINSYYSHTKIVIQIIYYLFIYLFYFFMLFLLDMLWAGVLCYRQI
jgi:hypothetical protein